MLDDFMIRTGFAGVGLALVEGPWAASFFGAVWPILEKQYLMPLYLVWRWFSLLNVTLNEDFSYASGFNLKKREASYNPLIRANRGCCDQSCWCFTHRCNANYPGCSGSNPRADT